MVETLSEDTGLCQRLAGIRHVALDMDGTIYCGNELFAETLPFLEFLRESGVGFSFLTNNSSKNSREYVKRLEALGIQAAVEDVMISSHAAVHVMKKEAPDAKRIFVLGTRSLREELADFGYTILDRNSPEKPEVVVVGFDTNMDYQDFCKAAYWIKAGVLYVATHPDAVCPTNEETILVDCGSICAAIDHATGCKPDFVAGKPGTLMIETLCSRLGLQPGQVAMVGDRLYTDILMATRSGALGVLTLTGETKRSDLDVATEKPDLVVENLRHFSDLIHQARHPEKETAVA